MNKALVAVAMAGAAMVATNASADTLIFNALSTDNAFNSIRSAGVAPAGVTTFAQPTVISAFGVLNAMAGPGTQVFNIFNEDTGTLLYQSGPKSFAGDGSTGLNANTYKVSDPFSFTFLPGTRYAIGSTSSVSTGFYVAFSAASQNGISVLNANDNIVGSSIAQSSYCCSTGLEFFAPSVAGAVPEPASWAMMILGMGAVGYSMRSAKRRSDEKFDAKIKRITYGIA